MIIICEGVMGRHCGRAMWEGNVGGQCGRAMWEGNVGGNVICEVRMRG